MSRPFAAVESFLERILERPAARLFHAHPQPVQLERRVERAMTAHRMIKGGRTYVPSKYRIALHPADLAALQAASDQLPADLAQAILQRARSQGYWFVARPEVHLVPSPRIAQGDLEVDAEALDPTLVSSAAAGLRPVGLEGPRPPRPPIPGTGVVPDPPQDRLSPMPPIAPAAPAAPDVTIEASAVAASGADVVPPWMPMEAASPNPESPQPSSSSAEVPPAPITPTPAADVVQATIQVQVPDKAPRAMVFRGGTLRVGRGTDNDIVLLDERVSRHHGRFTSRHGVMVYTDLESTNGSMVNGVRVREAGLGVGDVVRLGRATLTILPPV